MKKPATTTERPRRGRYVMAMVLGTALSALGSSAPGATPVAPRAVQDISRYCSVCWRNARLDPDSWPDCTQEVFCRLLERVAPEAWEQLLQVESEERREFLRAIDAVKKRTQRRRKWSSALLDTVADRQELHDRPLQDQRAAVHQVAPQLLTPRQQRILQLSFEGWAVQEIADALQLSAERVSDEKYKAIRKLRAHFERTEQEA